jgi:hypothetical protein
VIEAGSFKIKGSDITLQASAKQISAGACPTPGKYKFTLKGRDLTFKLIKDSKNVACIGRVDVLSGRTFKKV